jgi:hypothetical protein
MALLSGRQQKEGLKQKNNNETKAFNLFFVFLRRNQWDRDYEIFGITDRGINAEGGNSHCT